VTTFVNLVFNYILADNAGITAVYGEDIMEFENEEGIQARLQEALNEVTPPPSTPSPRVCALGRRARLDWTRPCRAYTHHLAPFGKLSLKAPTPYPAQSFLSVWLVI